MKKILGVIIISIFFVTSYNNLFTKDQNEESDCYVHRKIKDGSIGIWDWVDKFKACHDQGVNCEIIPCEDYKKQNIIRVPNGFNLILHIDNTKLNVKQPTGEWSEYLREGDNYTFARDEVIIIMQCDDFPELVGTEIDLFGYETDSNGDVTIFIPSE